jgi:hypothetical protein
MKNRGLVHDVLLVRSDGSKRMFRIYGMPRPEQGQIITLPMDGRSINARVPVLTTLTETKHWPDVAVVELVESDEMELV